MLRSFAASVLRRQTVVMVAVVPLALPAQERREAPRGRETRVSLSWTGDAPVEFNPQRCGSRGAMSLGGGLLGELLRRVLWGGRGEVNYANPFKREDCLFGRVEVPLPPGLYTRTL